MIPLVRAAARLAEAGLGRFAIVGGVAVAARLGRAHRATADVDAVVDEDTPPAAIDVIRDLPGAEPDETHRHRVYLDGTKVDVIETATVTEPDLDDLDAQQILFVAGHRWALETATPMMLTAEENVHASVPIARPSALLAMKLHAMKGRGAVSDKRGSDAWDIYRLITDLDIGATAAEMRSALTPLRLAITAAVDEIFVQHAGRTRGWLRTGGAEMASVQVDDLVAAGTDLLARLRAEQ